MKSSGNSRKAKRKRREEYDDDQDQPNVIGFPDWTNGVRDQIALLLKSWTTSK